MNIITNNTAKCSMGLDALLEVLDPEIGLNVVDLGLIYQLDFDDLAKKRILQHDIDYTILSDGSIHYKWC